MSKENDEQAYKKAVSAAKGIASIFGLSQNGIEDAYSPKMASHPHYRIEREGVKLSPNWGWKAVKDLYKKAGYDEPKEEDFFSSRGALIKDEAGVLYRITDAHFGTWRTTFVRHID